MYDTWYVILDIRYLVRHAWYVMSSARLTLGTDPFHIVLETISGTGMWFMIMTDKMDHDLDHLDHLDHLLDRNLPS